METPTERLLRLLKKYPGIKPTPLLEKAITRKAFPESVIKSALAKLLSVDE